MKKIILLVACFVFVAALSAQNSLSLTFVGQDQSGTYYRLDSVHIENLTREWSETLIYPDTELILSITEGVEDYLRPNMLFYPNPCRGNAYMSVENMQSGPVLVTVTDVQGRLCAEYSGIVSSGINNFHISLANPQLYFITVQNGQSKRSEKIVNVGFGNANRIECLGHFETESGVDYLKKMRFDSDALFVLSSHRSRWRMIP